MSTINPKAPFEGLEMDPSLMLSAIQTMATSYEFVHREKGTTTDPETGVTKFARIGKNMKKVIDRTTSIVEELDKVLTVGVPEEDKGLAMCIELSQSLKGDADDFVQGLPGATQDDWELLTAALRARYPPGSKLNDKVLDMEAFANLKQGPEEELRTYIARAKRLSVSMGVEFTQAAAGGVPGKGGTS